MHPKELIRKNIQRVLTEKNWKQTDLAKAMGNTDSHVSQLITGARWKGRMEWETYDKVCDALNVDKLELIKLPTCSKEKLSNQLAKGAPELQDDDVALVSQFLDILKHREILNPEHFRVLAGVMSMLQNKFKMS
jgi:DNA-binding Xre family transcriptional regulator